MEHFSAWVTIFIGVVIPFVGWIFRNLISKDIDDINTKQKEDRELFFKRFDDLKEEIETEYVRKDLYEQAMKFNNEHNDEKFKSLLAIMTTQFKNVEDKIEELKKLFSDKFSGHNNNKIGG